MPVYFEYALKASACLAIIFLFYHLLLKQITWYKWNRFFLLAFSAFSFIVPFININLFIEIRELQFIPVVNYLSSLPAKTPANILTHDVSINYWEVISAGYVFIVLVLFIRLVIQVLSIRKIKSGATVSFNGEVVIYDLPKPVLPFSFLNSIFINKHNYNNIELQEIIDHEHVHVRQKHTIDVLFAELICIINWYNPFAWLIKKAIKENLEFIADDAVIQKGAERKDYQYLLLKVTGIVPSSIANNFTFTSLKSRIRMMNKTKNGSIHLLKFALVIPLIAILLMAFRHKQEVYKNEVVKKDKITKTYVLSSLTYAVADKKVEEQVQKDKGNSLLKTGQALDLDLIFNEKNRLLNLLQNIGHANIDPHAITFMIDTTLGNNSFSIQVNINLISNELLKKEKYLPGDHNKITTQINPPENLVSLADDHHIQSQSFNQKNNNK